MKAGGLPTIEMMRKIPEFITSPNIGKGNFLFADLLQVQCLNISLPVSCAGSSSVIIPAL